MASQPVEAVVPPGLFVWLVCLVIASLLYLFGLVAITYLLPLEAWGWALGVMTACHVVLMLAIIPACRRLDLE